MDIRRLCTKDIGKLGELVAVEYLRRQGIKLIGQNIRATFGEIDVVAQKDNCLHIVEVKTLRCSEFPRPGADDLYVPSQKLHQAKIRKVARLGAWYVGSIGWEGEWQVDGAVVWLRERDSMARIRYYPQLL